MITGHIEDLIVMAKALPNSLHRNKIVSHLEDARAHALVLEKIDYDNHFIKQAEKVAASICTCPHYPGAQALDCPVHMIK